MFVCPAAFAGLLLAAVLGIIMMSLPLLGKGAMPLLGMNEGFNAYPP